MQFKYLRNLSDRVVKDYMHLTNSVLKKDHSIGLVKNLTHKSAKEFLKSKISREKSAFLLVYQNSELVGTGYICPSGYQTTKHYCEISKVMVDPDYQGHGTGRKIMQKLEEKAKQLGFTHVILDTWDIPHIVLFYEKCGYTIVGRIPEFVKYKGEYHDCFYFAKKLNKVKY